MTGVSSGSGRRASWLLATLLSGVGVLAAGCQADLGDPSAGAVVTVSSAGSGTAEDLTDTGSADDPGAVWTSKDGIGSWVEFSWVRPIVVDKLTFARAAEPAQRISAGVINFGDGSALRAQLDPERPTTSLEFPARQVSSLRFSVAGLAPGADLAGLAELVIGQVRPGAVTSQPGDPDRADRATTTTGSVDGTPWVQLTFPKAQELASVQLAGRAGAGTGPGTLTFADGSTVDVGRVLGDPDRPTTVAFLPRMSSSVRFQASSAGGDRALDLDRFRAYPAGVTPASSRTADDTTPRLPTSPACPATPARSAGTITVSCPATNAVVTGSSEITFTAPGLTEVEARLLGGGDGSTVLGQQRATISDGRGSVTLDFAAAGRGPVTVELSAVGASAEETPATRLQLYNASGEFEAGSPATPPPSALAAGRTLVYDDEFADQISMSRDGHGADYAAAKPNRTGAEDFGDAIFPDPALGFDNVGVVDGRYLRIAVEPNPNGFRDPNPWRRTHIGGLIASARSGGSGFSAQYGYFEARMLSPAAAGTWPAFWTLPSTSLATELPQVAEIDAVELYGHDPLTGCHSTHVHANGKDDANTQCGRRFDSAQAAVGWHVYGVDVTATKIDYFIDGQLVASAPQVAGGNQPMFFMVNLALGGGWPVELGPVGDRAALYVDYVRVYV